jgi:hypothetical protein
LTAGLHTEVPILSLNKWDSNIIANNYDYALAA